MKYETIIPAVLAAWWLVKKWIDGFSKIIEPLVVEIEARAKDNLIDKSDRKAILMKAIHILELQNRIKLNFLTRWIVSIVADKIAQKLPDFKVAKDTTFIVNKATAKL